MVSWVFGNFFWIQVASIAISLVLLVAVIRVIVKIDFYSSKREYGWEIWQLEKLRHKKLRRLWRQVLKQMASPEPDEWKKAVIEVETFFDDTVKAVGYVAPDAQSRLAKVEESRVSNIKDVIRIHPEIQSLKADLQSSLKHEKAKEYLRIFRHAFRQLGLLD